MVTLRKSDPIKLLGRRLLIVGMIMLVIVTAWGVRSIYGKEVDAKRLQFESENQLADLAAQEEKLQSGLDRLSTSRGVESVLRNNYSVGAPGENMIVIVEPRKPAATSTPNSSWQWIHNVIPW